MMGLRFTWNESKAKRNARVHKISFEVARNVFNDPYVVIFDDCETRDGEIRYHAIGYVSQRLMAVVVYIDLSEGEDERIHIISARKAEAFEEAIYAKQYTN